MTVSERMDMAILLGRRQQLASLVKDAERQLNEVDAQIEDYKQKLEQEKTDE